MAAGAASITLRNDETRIGPSGVVGWAKPPGPAGACHWAGPKTGSVCPPRLSLGGHGAPKSGLPDFGTQVGTAHRSRACPTSALNWARRTEVGLARLRHSKGVEIGNSRFRLSAPLPSQFRPESA